MDEVLLEKIEAISQPLVDRGVYDSRNDGDIYGLESDSERGEGCQH